MSFIPTGLSATIFSDRYALTPEETWQEFARRVAKQMALAEPVGKQKYYEDVFNEMIVENLFVPGGRVNYNSGRNNPQLLNCFVLTNKLDSKEGWGELARQMIVTSMTGGGCGIDFSDVRPRGARIGDQKGECPGPVELMRLIDNCAKPVRAGGQRRVALMFSLDLDHPDVLEFLDAKLVKGELTHANVSVRSKRTSVFIDAIKNDGDWELSWKGKFKKSIKARDLWKKIVENAYNSAEPGFLNWELVSGDSNIGYIEELVTTNPCVSGDTEILTDNGHVRIDSLVGQEVRVWNGFEWSDVTPKITGTNQPMMNIKFSDGRSLRCTEYHTFHIVTDYLGGTKTVRAKDLKTGMKLIKHEFPIIEHGPELKNAYTQGFVSADGMDDYNFIQVYAPKYQCLSRLYENQASLNDEKYGKRILRFKEALFPKSFIPFEYNLKSKLDWLSGLLDGDGCELVEGGMQLSSISLPFILGVQKLLTTLGVQSKVLSAMPAGDRLLPDGHGGSKSFYCQEAYRVCVGATQMQKLKTLGLSCERLSFNKEPQRDASQFTKIISVESGGIEEVVYCFNEPKRHLGIFNGVITGQCGEIALSSFDCCCLGHIVLPRFVKNGELDYAMLGNTVRNGVRFLDNVLTVNTYPLPEMKEKSHSLRRIGLGTTGLADTLAMLGIKYGSPEGVTFVDKLYKFIAKAAYEASIMLAVEKGMYPACDPDKHVQSGFMKRMPAKIRSLVKEHGIRNCAILTQAPTGTVSMLSGNCSSGIEPMFAPAYERRFFRGEERQTELVFHPLFQQFMLEGKPVDHFVGSYDLTVENHMEIQAAVQKWTDNAVSKTINMHEHYPMSNMEELWLKFLPVLKGTTFYRENSRPYIRPDGTVEPPPLTAIPIEKAKELFSETAKTEAAFVDDCVGGACDWKK